ncbi:polymer-forming cytoskeletal protein [Salinimicrobium tongyeongense]|jgi:cytoskeletal protein CcmA (bactofilin family)|uniref:Polymer-forming cytoskeletal protein n=1 Tax=Salinimicrobium tongyeongense TaxID=2809707 RepID=A0ABY6NUM1_9FLAO|nr:polymer-forming cytoskeletal protein [Salinimicrobium tongyeongense]UZH56610.1 polymer-forming cytoskeletal protein [Salinimicrobium tongyeongense]
MFKQEKTKLAVENSKEQNKISQGTKITGDIEAKGCFRIDGCVEGKVTTPGKVVIGKAGSVTGELSCENADIEGNFNGKLKISGTLSLRSTAVIEGEAVVARLAVEPGATFNATCTMRGGVKAIHNERGERERQKQEQSA